MTRGRAPGSTGRGRRRRGLAAVAALNALGAWGGAVGLVAGALSFGDELDRRLPFDSPVLAGAALAAVVAVPSTALAREAWRGGPRIERLAVVTGVLLLAWIAVQILVLRAFSWFQPVYAAVGLGLVVAGRWPLLHPVPLRHPVQLRDGTSVTLRPIERADAARLVRFHEGLSRETTTKRFFAAHPHLSPAEVERFTTVDHHDREALVLLDGADLVAVGRYERLPERDRAEVAFVVADGWQGRGGGHLLLAALAERARGEGISAFTAETLADNARMLAVFRGSGLPASETHHDGVVCVELQVSPAQVAAEPAAPGSGGLALPAEPGEQRTDHDTGQEQ